MIKLTKRALAIAVGAALIGPLFTTPAWAQKKSLVFVTNASADFWTIARRGTEKAAKELPNYEVRFIVPGEATAAEQKRILDDLLVKGVAGVAISPVNPAQATEILNKVADQAMLFTSDSDAPASKRSVYIGTDNVAAGVQAGELMKKTLPNGGKAMLFVGTMDNANARERVEGIRKAIAGSKIEIVDVRTDEIDFAKARRNAEDTLTKYPDIAMMVGLYSYNPPQIIEAVKAAGKAGKVKIVAFDEDGATLKAISEGIVAGTVVQQPFEFGYQSMIYLAKAIEGDKSFIPANKLRIVPTKIIDKDNVAKFQSDMKTMLGK